jgi:hypothetical protein
VFEDVALRKMFVPHRDEVRRVWRKQLNEGLCISYSSPNIIRMIKSRSTILAGPVMRMEGRRNA